MQDTSCWGVIASFTIPESFSAVFFYLSIYLLSAFLLFALIVQLSPAEDSQLTILDFRGLYAKNGFLGSMGVIGLGSLAGIPPLGGFIGKLLLLTVAFKAQLYGLLGVSLIGIVISIYYYFGWLREIVFNSEDLSKVPSTSVSYPDRILYGTILVLVVIAGLFPSLLMNWIQ